MAADLSAFAHDPHHWPTGPLVAGCEDCNEPSAVRARLADIPATRAGYIRWTDEGEPLPVLFRDHAPRQVLAGPETVLRMVAETIKVLPQYLDPEDVLGTVLGIVVLPCVGHAGYRDVLPVVGSVVECDANGDEL